MRVAPLVVLLTLAIGTAARADVVSPHADHVALTFYHEGSVATWELMHADKFPWIRNSGLAFVTETRTIDLPAGPAVVKFEGVASTMVPQTADIQGLPAGALERNFDYDLLSPGSLLAKSIGETVRLVRTDKKSGKRVEEQAIIRSGPFGVVFEVDGKFEALHCSELPEKLVFDHVPGGLADTPTLSMRTNSPAAGRYTIKLSYIATSLNWSADYVARIEPGSDTLALTGWLTLANFSATNFGNVPVDAVAGHLETTGADKPVHVEPLVLGTNCWQTKIDWGTYRAIAESVPPPPPAPPPMTAMMRASPVTVFATANKNIEAQALGDYKLYPLPEPVTVSAQQTKQIQFLDQPDVRFERLYQYTVYSDEPDQDQKAGVVLRLKNRAESGLGKPLPAGGVSVFEGSSKVGLLFAGQDAVQDLAVGLPIDIKVGQAADVPVDARLIESTTSGSGARKKKQNAIEIAVLNDKESPIIFELRQATGDIAITSETRSHILDQGFAVWRFPIAAGAKEVFRYAIEEPAGQ